MVVEGPKACGKTAAARQSAVREVLLNVDDNARRAVAVAPPLVLDGPTSRLLDEWQVESATWNHVRRAVDTRGQAGRLILTGSAVPSDDVTRHMGAGRIARLRTRRMASSRVGTRRGPSPSAPCSGARGPESRVVPQGPRSRRADRGRRVAGLAQALQAVRDYLDEVRRADIARVTAPIATPTTSAASCARWLGTWRRMWPPQHWPPTLEGRTVHSPATR
ncbi:MAG: AAA family ATPase [bacterium]